MKMNKLLLWALFPCAFASMAAAAPFAWTNALNGDASGSWAVPLNWNPNGIPGAADGADFSTLDITFDSVITLDANQSINALVFGDLDASTNSPVAGWTIDRGLLGTATLTLASPDPAIAVNDLSAGRSLTINARLAGSSGLIKSGPGTLRLGADSLYTGSTLVNAGTLQIGVASTSGSVPGGLQLNGGSVAFDRTDGYEQEGIITGNSVTSALRTTGNSGPTVLTFGEGTNLFGAIQNPGSSPLVLKAAANTTNFFPGPNVGAPNNGDGVFRNTSDNGTLVIDGGTWALNGANWSVGVGNMLRGTTIITNATLITGGARYMRGVMHLQRGASLLVTNSANITGGSANISRLSFEGDPPQGDVTGIYVDDGALLDVWAGGFALDIGAANAARGTNCVGFIHQRGGIVQRAVNGVSSGGNGRSIFIGSPNPEFTGYYTLEGGKLICTDLIGPRFSTPQYISTNYFNWTGGLLACRTFETRLLVGGALTNSGGMMAPGDMGLAARTTINGDYFVSASNAVMAIDIGGRAQANQAAGVLGVVDAYDNVQATNIRLGGRLEVRFFGGFETNITPADSFTIVSSAATHNSMGGTFNNLVNGRVPIIGLPGKSMRVTITNLTVVLDDFPTEPPQLSARIELETVMVVSWPTNNAIGFTLQATGDLPDPMNWINIAQEEVFEVDGTNKFIEFMDTGPRRFFRLRGP